MTYLNDIGCCSVTFDFDWCCWMMLTSFGYSCLEMFKTFNQLGQQSPFHECQNVRLGLQKQANTHCILANHFERCSVKCSVRLPGAS